MGDFDLRGLLAEAMARAGRGARELPGNAWRGTRAVLDSPPQELLPMLNPVPVDAIQGMASGQGNAGDVLQLIAALGLPAAGKLGKMAGRAHVPKSTVSRIIEQTREAGGHSVNLPTGKIPTEGLMMGQARAGTAASRMLPNMEAMTPASVREFVEANQARLSKPDSYLGSWRDPASGEVFLDISKQFDPADIRAATKYGERTGQRAGYDLGARAEGREPEFPVGSLPEFLKSPEFQQRMTEMQQVGRDYLDQHPNPNWWDIRGTALERVYGADELERVAGLTATTAPMLEPKPNLQQMSEYMRRHLKGEPIYQPDWRVPAGTMSRNEGARIGLPHKQNLQRADELKPLSGAKVESERKALLGDPDAVVLDRHWAKISEKPEAGVYVEPGAGKISSDKTYEMISDSVTEGAKAAGMTPRDFSANVWTGIRETIKTKNELFGQKFKKGSIQGESKSYADHFEDLLDEKAAHLGITKPELEARLRSGDANLLAWVIAATGIQSMLDDGAE